MATGKLGSCALLSAGNAGVSLNQSGNSSAFSLWYWQLCDKCLWYVSSFHIAALLTQYPMSKSCNSDTSRRLQLFCCFPVWVWIWSFTIVKNGNWAMS